MAARLVRASTTTRPALARKAGGAVAVNLAGGTQSPGDPPRGRSIRVAFLRSSRSGRPFDGSGGAGGSGAGRIGDSLATRILPIGRASLPSWRRIGTTLPAG